MFLLVKVDDMARLLGLEGSGYREPAGSQDRRAHGRDVWLDLPDKD